MDWPPKLPRNFPLTIHPRGYVKKGMGWICGKKTPEEALEIYHAKAMELAAGVAVVKPTPKAKPAGLTVNELAEKWLRVKLSDARAKAAAKARGETDAGD